MLFSLIALFIEMIFLVVIAFICCTSMWDIGCKKLAIFIGVLSIIVGLVGVAVLVSAGGTL